MIKKYDWLLVGVVALCYYAFSMSTIYTWIFVSSDSGEWLASSIWWMNSQPYGSPLYVLLGHLINWIMPNHLVVGMTFFLSVVPATISVATVYLIVKKLTDWYVGIISAVVLLGSAIFLTQATILEEYAISAMFVTLAYWFYINDKKKLTILMLALGSAVHIIVVVISVLFLIANITEIKQWWKTFWIYFVFGLLPYTYVLVLMALDTPKLLAGNLSWNGINNYLSATGTIGSISLYESPKRLLQFGMMMVVTFGFALVPMVKQLRHIISENKKYLILVMVMIFLVWVYITNKDDSTWTFLTFGLPMMVVIAGLGLYKLSRFHKQIVGIGACCLILINSISLNADTLAHQYPYATDYEKALKSLPDYTYVVSFSGGAYAMDNFYVLAQGKQAIPLYYAGVKPDDLKDTVVTPRYVAYKGWLKEKYGVQGENTMEQVRYLLSHGKLVLSTKATILPYWQPVFKLEEYNSTFYKIVGVNDGY